jgi:hypothetical protein
MVSALMVLALTGAAVLCGVAGGVSFALVPMLLTVPDIGHRPARNRAATLRDPLTPVILTPTLAIEVVLAIVSPRMGPKIGFAVAAVLSLVALSLMLRSRRPAPRGAALQAGQLGWSVVVVIALAVDVAAALNAGL